MPSYVDPSRLSDRQLSVLRLCAKGYEPKEIAHFLGVHHNKVYRDRERLRARAGSSRLPALMKLASSLGLSDVEDAE